MHYVIIGNGGAGISALQTIRDRDKESTITIISREKYPAYSPCSLPNLLSGEMERQKIYRFDKGFYKDLDARFIKNAEAIRISPKNKTVRLANGSDIEFDKLLIAVGAGPITPKGMVGLDLKGVHVMGNLDSTLGIISHAEKGIDNAVVVGGGFMGIETAIMLKKRGLDVTIVELLPDILARMLDPDVSEKVLKILKANGIKVILKDAVKSIDGKKKAEGVTLGNGSLECDMVVIAIGVQPNIGVVDGSDIKANRGIIVDGKMQTNRKDIYAAGDIAEVRERLTGQEGSFAIWPNAIEQGRVAGSNMAGVPMSYDGAEVVNVLDVFDTPIVAMGAISEDIGGCEIISRTTPHSFKKLLVKDKKIMGLQFVNTIRNTGPLYALMKRGAEIADIEDVLDGNYVFAPESPR